MKYFIWPFFIALLVFRLYQTKPVYKQGDRIRITTTITSEPIKYDTGQSVKVGGLATYFPLYPQISYGDRVIVEGKVKGKKLEDSQLVFVKPADNLLVEMRAKLTTFLKTSLPEPHGSLVAGIVLGAKSSFPEKFWNDLRTSGTTHVVVASGMNVTFVASFLIGILIVFLSRKKAVMIAMIGIWIYALLSGFDAPIVRAAVMGSIAFSAQALGRLSVAWRALFLSAFIMLIIWPFWITDLGFILSFVATASLMLFERKIASKVEFVPHIFREGLATSLAAQIGVAPIIFVTFGQFNLLSPIINALILWTVAPVMIIGGLAAIISLFWGNLAQLILYLSYPLTSWFVWVVGIFSH